jgi:hypothetical protein
MLGAWGKIKSSPSIISLSPEQKEGTSGKSILSRNKKDWNRSPPKKQFV